MIPEDTDTTTTLTFPDPGGQSGYIAVLFQGFFIDQETGEYRFMTNSGSDKRRRTENRVSWDGVDNWAYLWPGEKAYYDWDQSNWDYEAFYLLNDTDNQNNWATKDGNFTVTMREGDAIPITYLWANGGGTGRSRFIIKTPRRTVVESSHEGWFVTACTDTIFNPDFQCGKKRRSIFGAWARHGTEAAAC